MKLGGDKTRLTLHELGVILPDLQKGKLVALVEDERIDEHHRPCVNSDLALDRRATWAAIARTFNASSTIFIMRALSNSRPTLTTRRAQLVVLTEKGQRAFDSAMELQAPWINDMAAGFSAKDLRTMHRLIAALRDKLESEEK